MSEKNRDRLGLIVSMLIFGTIGIVRRYIPCSSAVVALVRGAVGVVTLAAVRLIAGLVRREKPALPKLRGNAALLIVSGVLIGANWICLFEAYRLTTVSVATVCYYMAPVFVMLASPVFLGEKLTPVKSVCALLAFTGMLLVSGVFESGFTGITGILFALAAAAMYASVIILNKKLKDISAPDRTLFQLAAASVALLPYVLLTEQSAPAQAAIPAGAVALLILAGIVHTGIAYTMYFGSMRSLSAQTVALFSYIDPVTALVLSALILNERMSPAAIAGAALVIVAAAAGELMGEKQQARA